MEWRVLAVLCLVVSSVAAKRVGQVGQLAPSAGPPKACAAVTQLPPAQALGWACTTGSSLDESIAAGTQCSPKCPTGFLPQGVITCDGATGNWEAKSNFFRCYEGTCPMRSVQKQALGGIFCECEENYHGTIVWDEKEHYWRGSCQGGVCEDEPPEGDNGQQTFCGKGSAVGTSCHFGCDDGYLLIDLGPESVCQPNGQWSPLRKMCQSSCIGPAPSVENGRNQFCEGRVTQGRTRCSLNCAPNFVRTAGRDTFCDSYGNWIQGTAKCIPAPGHCPAVPTVPNGVLTGENCTLAAPHGSSCTLVCNDFFKKSAAGNEATCDSGSWTKTTFTCDSVPCLESPPEVEHGIQLRCAEGDPSGTRCRVKCFPPYRRSRDTEETVCQLDGTWSTANLTTCVLKSSTPVPTAASTSASTDANPASTASQGGK